MNGMLEVLDMIIKDMDDGAAALDGKPFTGKTLAIELGATYATIQALAKIMKKHLTECTATAEASESEMKEPRKPFVLLGEKPAEHNSTGPEAKKEVTT